MVGTRCGGRRVFTLGVFALFIIVPAVRAQKPTPADHLKAGVARLEAGDFLMGLMTLNEVVAPGSNADQPTVARAHAYRAQANLGLEQPERARAAALLALKADPSMVVTAPPFSAAVAALFEGLRHPSATDPETAGLAAERSAPVATPPPAAPKVVSVFIYWPRGIRGGGKRKVLCDGFHVADLVNRRFVVLNLKPGRHEIKVNNRTLPLSFEAGRPYYLRTFVGGYPARLQFREAVRDEAASELNDKDMRANDPERTYSGECNAGAAKPKR